jgi:hypothetical protein
MSVAGTGSCISFETITIQLRDIGNSRSGVVDVAHM